MNDGLKDKHRRAIIDVLAAHPGVEKAVLFGSRAMETFTPESDVDIALFGDSLSLTDQARFARKIDELPMPQRAGLLRYKTIKDKKLLAHIRKHGVEWFSRTRPGKTLSGETERCSAMAGEMPSGWQVRSIEHSMSAIIDYRGKTPKKTTAGIPLITAKIVKDGRILPTSEYIAPEDYDAWMRRGLPQEGDVVMTTEAPLGEIAQLDRRKIALAQRLITLRGKEGVLDNTFLKFAMQSSFLQDQLRARATGTTVIGIKQRELRKVILRLPPLMEQRAIARILGTLDDNIELNRRMNETLEGMARAIFKSWFVDFDPVRAKAEGRKPPGLDPATAALFPDSFEKSKLGLIPKGWNVAPLGQHTEAVKGLSYKGKFLSDVGIPLHNLNSVLEGGGYKYAGLKRYAGEYKERHLVKPGDVIVTNTEQGFEYLLIGCPALVPECYGGTGLYTHHIYRVRQVAQSCLTPHFIYLLLLSRRFREVVTGYTNGTTVNMLPVDGLQRPEFVLPPAAAARRLEAEVKPLFGRQERLYEESGSLAKVRDALLPKLLSGEIRVGRAEKIVEEVT